MPARLVRRAGASLLAAFLLIPGLIVPAPVVALSPDIVISQVYGGGGNSGATYTHDFIELFNRGASSVSLAGWSVQYASATGTGNFGSSSTQLTELPNVSLAPGQYLLVQEAQGSGGTTALPTPDVIDASPIAMSGSAGKVALVTSATSLGCNGGSTPCSPAQAALIKDLVGYGTANFFEGAAAPGLSNSTAAIRESNGCAETDDNSTDFVAGAPTPRNTSSPLNVCAGETAPEVASTSPEGGSVGVALDADIGITFSEAVDVTGDWYSISCGTSGSHTATVSGGPTTFTLDPDSDFVGDESCTVTITAANVTDQDADDPPDAMAADATITFTTTGCGLPFTPIYAIQGSGSGAAITGVVTTQGVVVGDFEGSASASGFYVQDATGDGDAGTSDGIFVYTGSSDLVSIGQAVRITGYARERFNQTALNGSNSNFAAVMDVEVCADAGGAPVVTPTDVTLPFASATFPERYEGMLTRFPQALVISEYFNYDRFGEMVLALPLAGETRAFTGTAIDEPGAPANARTLANSLSRITLDDAQSAQNPPVLRHPNGQPFSLTNRFRGGDTVQDAIGVLGFDFSLYRIFPTGPATYTATNPRPAAPEAVGGRLQVASLNTLNYFVTLDPLDDSTSNDNPADNICGPTGVEHDCRGADLSQPDELTRQRAKLLATLTGLDADVIGLNELENTLGVEPLADIVAGLTGYAYIDTGTIGTDAIKVGLIYRPSVVTPVGGYAILDSSVDPRFLDDFNRPVLAQTFEENATGLRFTVAVNHLKSKGSDCNDVGDPDTGDGQGNCNLTRKAAAEALVDWLATDPTASGSLDFLIIGDLNSYAMEDPIDAVKAGSDDTVGTADDYVDLIARFQGTYAYSYVFDGQAGYLDHALASATLADQVTGAADWHVNADEPDILDYDTSFKPAAQEALYEPNAYRSSDHDPLVIGLDLTYDFVGFYPPLSAAPATYDAKAGSRIPLKFSLGGDYGLDVLDGAPQVFACGEWPSGASVDAVTNPLVYDPSIDEYKLEWKTDKAWAGGCLVIEVRFIDGTYRLVEVHFK